MKLTWVVLLLAGLSLPLQAADLVTREGKVYRDYTVVSHDVGFLTILFADSGARIPLKDLSDELQKAYDYDPVMAAAYVAKFDAADKQQASTVQPQAPVTASAATPVSDGHELVSPQDSSVTPAPSVASASKADADSSTFDTGVDPLAPNTDALALHSQTYNDSPDQVNSGYAYSNLVITDEGDGGYWFTYNDASGVRQHRFRSHQTYLGSGQWVTSVDAQGRQHREFRRAARSGTPSQVSGVTSSGSFQGSTSGGTRMINQSSGTSNTGQSGSSTRLIVVPSSTSSYQRSTPTYPVAPSSTPAPSVGTWHH